MERKNKKKRMATTTPFFEDPEIKKIMADPKRRASINEKILYLSLEQDIEDLRVAEGISQKELEKRTGITQGELSRIEHGKRNITMNTYFRYLSGLGYEPVIKYRKIKDKHP